VVDAESSDGTAELARAHGARVVVRPWEGFVTARRFALTEARTPWVFMLDADEVLDEGLRAALAGALDPAFVGYPAERTTFFCGRPIAGIGWGRERVLRLVRADRARVVPNPATWGTADLHERLVVDGAVGPPLPGSLLHDSYPTLRAYAEKYARYTTIEAAGLRPTPWSVLRTAAFALLRAPYLFLFKGGWRDGWRGAFLSVASAMYPLVATWKALRR